MRKEQTWRKAELEKQSITVELEEWSGKGWNGVGVLGHRNC